MKKVLELQMGFIADIAIDVKSKRFGENFITMEECYAISELVRQRLNRNELKVLFLNNFSKGIFNIQNEIITKNYGSLKLLISNHEVRNVIYDEEFIYFCICQVMINKLNDSIKHNCLTCTNKYCAGDKNLNSDTSCSRWEYDFLKETPIELGKRLLLK